jgi:methionyl-tRNA formyltransferase
MTDAIVDGALWANDLVHLERLESNRGNYASVPRTSLRVVTFNVFPPMYRVVAEWAARHGHRLVLLVTVPGGQARRYATEDPPLLDVLPRDQDVLVTTRMRRTAPAIAALRPDLLIAASFPLRIPPEVIALPRFGTLNLHPSPLPRGRGPNPMRGLYEGDPTIACTVHRVEPEFDTGAILSRRERPRPADLCAGDLVGHWLELSEEVLEEATARAVAGERGEPQDPDAATHWPAFTEEERWLDWGEEAATVQRRAAALNAIAPTARAMLDGRAVLVRDVRALPGLTASAIPGAVLDREGDLAVVCVGDGVVSVRARPASAVLLESQRDELAVATAPVPTDLATRSRALSPDQQHDTTAELVRTAAAAVLGCTTPDTITADQPSKDLGIDSFSALELRNTLTHMTGLILPPTIVLSDRFIPTVLATYLITQLSHNPTPMADAAHPNGGSNSVNSVRHASIPQRIDHYDILCFSERNPDDANLVHLARAVHALGFRNDGFVTPEAISGSGDNIELLEELDPSRGPDVDYYLAMRNHHDVATVRKKRIPEGGSFEDLPAYRMTRENIPEKNTIKLREAARVYELGALARAESASPLSALELFRHVIHEALGRGEVWMLGVVHETFDKFTKDFGNRAIEQIGGPVAIDRKFVRSGLELVPAIIDVDNFIRGIYLSACEVRITDPQTAQRRRELIMSFRFFAEGLGEDKFDLREARNRHESVSIKAGAV